MKSFEDPIRLKLTSPAEKFEIIGVRIGDTLSMTLRAIEIVRETAEQVEELVDSVNIEKFEAADAVSAVQEVPAVQWIPAVLEGRARIAAAVPKAGRFAGTRPRGRGSYGEAGRLFHLGHDRESAFAAVDRPGYGVDRRDAFGVGSTNSLRAGAKIEFDASSQGAVHEPVLFSGATLRLAPGEYSFQLRGALKGSLKLRFINGPRGERLQDAVVKTFDAPVRVLVEEPLESFEIVGLRTKNTLAMSLTSIEVSASPLISSS